MPTHRWGHSCGLVQDPVNGPEVIVAGGRDLARDGVYWDTVDIYSIDTDSWREGIFIRKHLEKNVTECIYDLQPIPFHNPSTEPAKYRMATHFS